MNTQRVSDYKFRPRKKREVYDKTLWETLEPGIGLSVQTSNEAAALETFSRARGWTVRREKQDDGTFVVGRIS